MTVAADKIPSTKAAIYEAMSTTNGLLAQARFAVETNQLDEAKAYVEAANIAVLSAKVRIAQRIEEGK